MGIRSNYKPVVFGTQHPAPPAFRATEKGLGIAGNRFNATRENANASLTQLGVKATFGAGHLSKTYLFVTRIRTSWSVSGSYGQAMLSRTWYPRNLSQSDLIIEGQVANQHEYDKLVEFVQSHQRNIIELTDELIGPANDPGRQVRGVDFMLWQPKSNRTFGGTPLELIPPGEGGERQFKMGIAITNIKAGHERFQFAPAFTLTCKVINDYLRGNDDTQVEILSDLWQQEVFGDLKTPDAVGPEWDGMIKDRTGRKLKINKKISGKRNAPPGGGKPPPGGGDGPPGDKNPPPPPPSGGGAAPQTFWADSGDGFGCDARFCIDGLPNDGNTWTDGEGNTYDQGGLSTSGRGSVHGQGCASCAEYGDHGTNPCGC